MKNNIVMIIVIAMLFFSCSDKKKDHQQNIVANLNMETAKNLDGYNLLKTKCYACHNPNAASHDQIIAPPMAAVKMRYQIKFKTKDSFVDAIADWATNPEEDRARMRGAVMRFKVMPKQGFEENDIRKIAAFMYENELEQPEWFASHEKEMHKGGR